MAITARTSRVSRVYAFVMTSHESNAGSAWCVGELRAARDAIEAVLNDASLLASVQTATHAIIDRLRSGGTLLAIGNGGSACDAMHLCEELTGRFRANRPAIPAIACTDPGHLTCAANDFGYENVFRRWVEAHARSGDVLIALSTSGNSENIRRAVNTAKAAGTYTLSLLGKGGGSLAGVADADWTVPTFSPATPGHEIVHSDRIQEVHMLLLHILVGEIERGLFGADTARTGTDRPLSEFLRS